MFLNKLQMVKNVIKKTSIFHRLLIVLIILFIFISGLLTFIFFNYSKNLLKEHMIEDIIRLSKEIEYYFESEIVINTKKDLYQICKSPNMNRYLMSGEIEKAITRHELENLFSGYINYEDEYQSIYFIDHSGKEKIRVDRKKRIKEYRDFKNTKFFNEIKLTVPDQITIYGPYKDKKGKVLFSAGINKTDEDTGKFGGTIIIDYALQNFIFKIDDLKINNENFIWIFSNTGWEINKTNKAISEPKAYYLSKEFHKTPMVKICDKCLLLYQDLSIIENNPLLRFVISIPSSLFIQNIKSMIKFFCVIFLFSIIIVSVIVYYLSKYISKPIIELANASRYVAEGNLFTEIKIKSEGEVQVLIDNFNRMIRNLERTTFSKNYIDSIIKSITDSLIVLNFDGTIKTVNQATLDLLGYTEEEILGKPISSLFVEDIIKKIKWDKILLDGSGKNYEMTYITKNIEKITIDLSASVMKDKYGELIGFIVIIRDIRRLKKLQAQLIQSDKLSAIGQLAGGIAHEINNPMGVILGFAQSIIKRIDEKNPYYMPLKSIEREAIRCKKLVTDMLTFARTAKTENEKVNINIVIDETLALIEAQTRIKNIIIIREFDDYLPETMVNRNQIQQVIMNICNNAIFAMQKGGTIKIVTKIYEKIIDSSELISPTGLIKLDSPGNNLNEENQSFIEISINDTGTGIPKDLQKNIFEPFFTTKEVGKGTGLGLSLCYEIIQKHNGNIRFESEIGKGTTFFITLPLNN